MVKADFFTKYTRTNYREANEYVPNKKQSICLNCSLPESQCKGTAECMRKRQKEQKK